MGQLVFKNLSLELDNRKLLDNIDFQVTEGRSLVIVGESGSGKTLISKLLIGRRPENAKLSGKILLDDISVLDVSPKEWMALRGKKVAYIAQNPIGLFNESQTIISHGKELFKSKLGLTSEECGERLVTALKKFNLQEPEKILNKYPFQLSGGMLQRIMIAMIMEMNPEYLIADEPTSALDWYNTENVINILETCKKLGTTLIVITHDFNLAKKLADEIAIMRLGELIEFGTADDVLNNPKSDYGKALMQPRVFKRAGR